jgi:2-polyprenyl-6-methoxyphenol hydroxylase-like FAD-dependent oxidoreductase
MKVCLREAKVDVASTGTYLTCMRRATILVSGAGIAGPTIAYWLLRRGFVPILIERAPRFREGGYMIDFWAVGFDVAERMGLIPTLRKTGYSISRVAFVTKHGRPRSALGRKALEHALGARFLSILRGDLARAIYETVRPGVETIFGDSIVEISQGAQGVEVRFERAAPRTVDLVVGADGLNSAVRTAVFGPRQKFERYLGYYAASFVTSGYPKRDEHTYLSYAAPGRQISRYALRDHRTAFFFVFERQNQFAETPHDPAAQKQILRDIFSREPWVEWPEIARRLDVCDDLYFDVVSQIVLPCWSRERTVLIGDAAYCPSLLAGEGAAFAMAGAYIVAAELERAGVAYGRAFAEYERRLRPFIERKQQLARGFAASFAPRTSFGLFARDQVIRLTEVPVIGDFLMRRFLGNDFVLPDYPPTCSGHPPETRPTG